MNAIHIEIDGKEVTVQTIGDKLHISVPKDLKTEVEVRNSGIPGIIGPDIEIDIQTEIEKIVSDAQDRAEKN